MKPQNDVYSPMNLYTDITLNAVYTLSEAVLVWGKARKTIETQIYKGRLQARKATTGGTILITRASLVRLWGEPETELDEVSQCWIYEDSQS